MISATVQIGDEHGLPRRDLLAILPYLNRKELEPKPATDMEPGSDECVDNLSLRPADNDHRHSGHANDK